MNVKITNISTMKHDFQKQNESGGNATGLTNVTDYIKCNCLQNDILKVSEFRNKMGTNY